MSLRGTQDADLLRNGPGYFYSNLVEGFGGDDTLIAYTQQDTLEGGQGDDLIEGGSVSYEHAAGPVQVVFTDPDPQRVGADQGVDTLAEVVGLIGSSYNDTLSAGSNDSSAHSGGPQMFGGDGDDSLIGGAGYDSLFGGYGADTLDASASVGAVAVGGYGDDLILLNPHAGFTSAAGDSGNDRIFDAVEATGGGGADTITGARNWGGGGGAFLWGDAGDDSLVGTAVEDQLYGGPGRNTIDGGGGGDTIYVLDHPGAFGLTNTDPSDTVLYRQDIVRESGAGNTLSFFGAPDDVQASVDLRTGAAHVDRVTASGLQALADVTFSSVDGVIGSSGADTIIGGMQGSTLAGDEGADSITGVGGTNLLDGDAGNDTIVGGTGKDIARGLDDNDSIDGGGGDDDVNGNKGEDTVHGGVGADLVRGGQGNDLVFGDDGSDVHVNGNIGDDVVHGGAGADSVFGGQGDDRVYGDDGDDYVSGDLGSDTLTGGAGADSFHLGANGGHDVVTDFNASEGDHVVLDHGAVYTVAQSASDTVVSLNTGEQLTLLGVNSSALQSGWLVVG